MLVPAEELRALAEGILCANGVPPAHAKIQAGLFVEAELRGVPSHGLLRLRRVIERIKAGLSVPGGSGTQVWTARSFLSVDGNRGLGPVVAMAALEAIMPRARAKTASPSPLSATPIIWGRLPIMPSMSPSWA